MRWRYSVSGMSDSAALRGRRILVTGGATGIGAAAVAVLTEAGAEVVAACFVVDLPALGGADRLRAQGVAVSTLLAFDGH